MTDEYRYLFVGDIPILYSKARVARQFQVEIWLDMTPLYDALGLEKPEPAKTKLDYIV